MGKLLLKPFKEGIKIGERANGKPYSVRDDRSRYFFPDEWNIFFNSLKDDQKMIFDILINTGARIEEALNIKVTDFDFIRNTLTLRVTKIKAKKGEHVGKKRTFVISSQLSRRVKAYILKNKLNSYDKLFNITKQGVSQLLRRRLEILIKDYYQFSLHNIRKTHGNWLNALDVPAREICLRLGHDMNTYLKHYGSPSVFDRNDKQMMIKILGDVYGIK